jgi:hypothetical protein
MDCECWPSRGQKTQPVQYPPLRGPVKEKDRFAVVRSLEPAVARILGKEPAAAEEAEKEVQAIREKKFRPAPDE